MADIAPNNDNRSKQPRPSSNSVSKGGSQATLLMTRAFILCESRLKRFIGRFLYRPEDVDELAQETFLRAFVASKTTQVRSPEAYLYRVAKHIALKELDRKSTRMTDFLEEAISEDAIPGHAAIDEELIAEQKLSCYCDAVASLPPQCRKVFLMRKVQAKSYQEISQVLDISISAVEKHVSKGIERFDDYMALQDDDYQRQSRAYDVSATNDTSRKEVK